MLSRCWWALICRTIRFERSSVSVSAPLGGSRLYCLLAADSSWPLIPQPPWLQSPPPPPWKHLCKLQQEIMEINDMEFYLQVAGDRGPLSLSVNSRMFIRYGFNWLLQVAYWFISVYIGLHIFLRIYEKDFHNLYMLVSRMATWVPHRRWLRVLYRLFVSFT